MDKLQEWTIDQAANVIHHFCVSKQRLRIVKGVKAGFKNDRLIHLMSPERNFQPPGIITQTSSDMLNFLPGSSDRIHLGILRKKL